MLAYGDGNCFSPAMNSTTTDTARYLTDLSTGKSLTGFVPLSLVEILNLNAAEEAQYLINEKNEAAARRAAWVAAQPEGRS